MAGLLDYLSGPDYGSGVGGLLSYLQSPLYRAPPAAPAPQPQYDAMGNYTGITPDAPSPFGPIPQMSMPTPAQFQPPSAFNGGVPTSPIAGLQGGSAAPALPPTQTVAPATQMADAARSMNIGGYQMPRIGNPDEYVPQQAMTPPNAAPAQGQMPQGIPQQSAPQQLPPALGGGLSGVGRMFNPNGMIARLTGNDSQSIAQKNLKAQYDSLVPVLGPQKAMLAIMNPEAGKTLLQEALSNKEKFTEIGVDANGVKQYGFVNDKEQTVTPYKMQGGDTPGFVTGPDGKPIPIPPGVDPKTFRNEVSRANAKAAAGEKTEVQAKAEIFANKMEMSNKEISDGIGTSLTGKIASGIPLGNYVQSPEYQKYKQASSNFITALLRQESGAAISKSEFDRYDKEYMPQPGDSKEVLAQKAQARQVAIEGMKKGAGPGYKSPTELGPQVGTVQMGYRFKGGNPADRNSWEKVQ
jgi:hypothetical protein